MATKNDKVILKLKEEIKEKTAALAKVKKFKPVTNCSLSLNGTRTNLHVAQKPELGLLLAQVTTLDNAFNEHFPEEHLEIDGFKATDWIKDIKAKYEIQNVSTEKKRLAALEKQLHDLLSLDTKVELSIEDLKNQI